MSTVDAFIVKNSHILTQRHLAQLAIMNALAHEVRPDGKSFVDHPKDPGGATNWGISLRFLLKSETGDTDGDGFADFDLDRDGDIDGDDIRFVTINQAGELYHKHFWKPHGINKLPPRIAVKVFDMAVNMGPAQAVKLLQRALNIFGHGLKIDGKLGPKTLIAAKARNDIQGLLDEVRTSTELFYRELADLKPDFNVFLVGWLKRAVT